MRRPYIDSSEPTLLRTLGLGGEATTLRASDAERERAVEILRKHHADGRLDTDEFEERTQRAYSATTLGDLDQLFGDLPRLRTPDDERRPRRQWPRPFALPLVAALVAIAALTSAHVLWLVWPLTFFVFLRFARRGHRWRGGWPQPWQHY